MRYQEYLPLRARYYQTMIDLEDLERGGLYSNLNKSYVIFICTFDPFKTKESRHRYTFVSRCEEEPSLVLGDRKTYVFLNTESILNDVGPELRSFLDYVGGRETDDEFVEELKKRVEKVKQSRDERREYMTFELRMQDAQMEGEKRGLEQGQTRTLFGLVQKGRITPEEGAEELSLPLDRFIERMLAQGYKLPQK